MKLRAKFREHKNKTYLVLTPASQFFDIESQPYAIPISKKRAAELMAYIIELGPSSLEFNRD